MTIVEKGGSGVETALERDGLTLTEWRRTVAELYAAVRKAPEPGRLIAWQDWRASRNDLFKAHPQSPLDEGQRKAFHGLPYYDYDPEWRVIGRVERKAMTAETLAVQLAQDGEFRYTRIARVFFTVKGLRAQLSLFWIEGYGGGLFLPFKDGTNGNGSYGGGRYLYDSIKGVDLGAGKDAIVLDFNYAYNPSCAYHPRWVCPLSPRENTLPIAVTAGEKAFSL